MADTHFGVDHPMAAKAGGGSDVPPSPTVPTFYILTENGNILITESGNRLQRE